VIDITGYYAQAGYVPTGVNNTAVGDSADQQPKRQGKTAFGVGALASNTTGSGNIGIGYAASASVSGSSSFNIHIGSGGASSDNRAIRIGEQGIQTSFSPPEFAESPLAATMPSRSSSTLTAN